MKLLLLFVLSMVVYLPVHSQTNSLSVIPPSPDAAAFAKYAEVPTGGYTGIPPIDIPLHTISSGRVSVPLSLSYHAGGIKVEDVASNIGAGWTLQGLASISRSVQGLPDDQPQMGFFNNGVQTDKPISNDDMFEIAQNHIDTQPDAYYFNVGNYSGQIIFDRNGRPYTIPHSNLLIKPGIGPLSGGSDSWEITTEDGTVYVLDRKEITTAVTYCAVNNGIVNQPQTPAYVSAWYVTEIKEPHQANTVTFSYFSIPTLKYEVKGTISQTHTDNLAVEPSRTSYCNSEITITAYAVIDKITYRGGSVEFARAARLDLPGALRIGGMTIKNYRSEVLKSFVFDNDHYFDALCSGSECLRLKLKALTEIGSDGSKKPPYKFTYNSTKLPSRKSLDTDYWGYFNNKGNTLGYPDFQDYFDEAPDIHALPGDDKGADPQAAMAGVLTGIDYPTGGSIQYDYELNEVISPRLRNKTTKLETYSIKKTAGDPDHPITEATFTIKGYFKKGLYVRVKYQTTGCQTKTGHDGSGNRDPSDTPGLPGVPDIPGTPSVPGTPGLPDDPGTPKVPPGSGTPGDPGIPSIQANCPSILITNTRKATDQHIFQAVDITEGSLFLDNGTYKITVANVTGNQTYFMDASFLPEIDSPNKYGGGLRVKHVSVADDFGGAITKDYSYNDTDGTTTGRLSNYPKNYYQDIHYVAVTYDPKFPPVEQLVNRFTRTTESSATLGNTRGSYVGYGKVTETNSAMGTSEYYYTSIWKSEKENSTTYVDAYVYDLPFGPAQYDREWTRGFLSKQIDYSDKVVNNKMVSTPVREVNHLYSVLGTANEIFGVKAAIYSHHDLLKSENQYRSTLIQRYGNLSYVLTTTTEDVKSSSGTVSVKKEYQFSSTHRQLQMETETFLEDADTPANNWRRTTNFRYPDDYTITSTTDDAANALDKMMKMHLVNTVIEKQVWETRNNRTALTDAEINLFNTNGYDLRQTLKLSAAKALSGYKSSAINASGAFEYQKANFTAVVTYGAYDAANGNLAFYTLRDGTRKSYQWGLNKLYPVAETTHTGQAPAFFIDFEEDGNSSAGDAHTGSKSKIGGLQYNLKKLVTGRYVLSYWSKSTDPLKSNDLWEYQQKLIDVTGTTYAISLTGQIDDVRFYPEGAQMTTATYFPGVGVQSATDANNLTTYFKYDGFGRLKTVRDTDRNLVKKLQYNYRAK